MGIFNAHIQIPFDYKLSSLGILLSVYQSIVGDQTDNHAAVHSAISMDEYLAMHTKDVILCRRCHHFSSFFNPSKVQKNLLSHWVKHWNFDSKDFQAKPNLKISRYILQPYIRKKYNATAILWSVSDQWWTLITLLRFSASWYSSKLCSWNRQFLFREYVFATRHHKLAKVDSRRSRATREKSGMERNGTGSNFQHQFSTRLRASEFLHWDSLSSPRLKL